MSGKADAGFPSDLAQIKALGGALSKKRQCGRSGYSLFVSCDPARLAAS
jgi:hypothetical protein